MRTLAYRVLYGVSRERVPASSLTPRLRTAHHRGEPRSREDQSILETTAGRQCRSPGHPEVIGRHAYRHAEEGELQQSTLRPALATTVETVEADKGHGWQPTAGCNSEAMTHSSSRGRGEPSPPSHAATATRPVSQPHGAASAGTDRTDVPQTRTAPEPRTHP